MKQHETASEMRQRLERESFWRSVFWQGENGGKPAVEGADPRIVKHVEEAELKQIKTCDLHEIQLKGNTNEQRIR